MDILKESQTKHLCSQNPLILVDEFPKAIITLFDALTIQSLNAQIRVYKSVVFVHVSTKIGTDESQKTEYTYIFLLFFYKILQRVI